MRALRGLSHRDKDQAFKDKEKRTEHAKTRKGDKLSPEEVLKNWTRTIISEVKLTIPLLLH